jgi:hypothetical protein
MQREGPVLERLIHRLADAPEDFLGEPRIARSGKVHVAAVVHDLCRLLGHAPTSLELQPFTGSDVKGDRNALAVTLLLAWLLADECFTQNPPERAALLALLGEGARELASGTASAKFVSDPERREELSRFALARLGQRPAGETQAQAEDRLTSLSAVERARVLRAAKAAEARARRIREELARKAAEESADKWSRD